MLDTISFEPLEYVCSLERMRNYLVYEKRENSEITISDAHAVCHLLALEKVGVTFVKGTS